MIYRAYAPTQILKISGDVINLRKLYSIQQETLTMNNNINTQAKPAKKLTLHKESILLLQPGQQAQSQGFVSAGCKDTNDC